MRSTLPAKSKAISKFKMLFFILAWISGQNCSKNGRASTCAVCHVLYFRFNLRSSFEQKCQSFCLASLGHVRYFASISVKIRSKNARASASLRSATSPATCFIFASISVQIWRRSKNGASASLRSARPFALSFMFKVIINI